MSEKKTTLSTILKSIEAWLRQLIREEAKDIWGERDHCPHCGTISEQPDDKTLMSIFAKEEEQGKRYEMEPTPQPQVEVVILPEAQRAQEVPHPPPMSSGDSTTQAGESKSTNGKENAIARGVEEPPHSPPTSTNTEATTPLASDSNTSGGGTAPATSAKNPPHRPKGSRNIVSSDSEGFVSFWGVYPWKNNKAAARTAWAKLDPSDDLVADILEALKWQKAEWKRRGIGTPLPSTWLNGRRWEDEPIPREYDTPKRQEPVKAAPPQPKYQDASKIFTCNFHRNPANEERRAPMPSPVSCATCARIQTEEDKDDLNF